MRLSLLLLLPVVLFVSSCEEEKPKATGSKTPARQTFVPVSKPLFSADSAYSFIANQVAFGPRVAGMASHAKCAEYLSSKMQSFGWKVQIQKATVTAFDGTELPIQNIISSFNPENSERILFFAHWDTRPFADRDDQDQTKPILGANDGASGVGVLMELARLIGNDSLKPAIGIDIIFFDAEDYGQPQGLMSNQNGETWCLGSQYWGKNPHVANYKAKYGILLDMVGAKNAVFPREGGSLRFNPKLVDQVWFLANKLGYGGYFINELAPGGITDDHVYVSTLAGIPSIDIIHYHPFKRDFGHFHHRHTDNMDVIHKPTLEAVGTTMLEVIYRE